MDDPISRKAAIGCLGNSPEQICMPWSVIVLLLIGLGWVVWNFDQEVENLEKENAGLRNRITKLEGDKQ